jgi:crossover junction endodeoxyribonuclease RuvC
MKHYIGIDPGSHGYIVVLDENGDHVTDLAIEDSTDQDIDRLFHTLGEVKCFAAMEKVHSMPGQGVATTFAFGQNVGFLLGMLAAFQIPYTLVTPQKWQKAMWITDDMVYSIRKDKNGEDKRQVAPKPTSINAATRLFPTTDLRKSERARNPHDGKCDALLIALYAKRMNL